MSISKRDFAAIADVLRHEREQAAAATHDAGTATTLTAAAYARHRLDEAARALASYCAGQNPRFDRARFLAACGVTP